MGDQRRLRCQVPGQVQHRHGPRRCGNNNDTPKDEHPDIAEGIANGTWGGTPRPPPAASATSTIPQTSDSMPIGLLAGTAAIAAAAIALLLVLRKRRQQ